MRSSRLVAAVVLCAAVAVVARAQAPQSTSADTLRSSIKATVRDSLGYPVMAASVFITPGGYIFRTDSAGTFAARNVPPGALTIAVRRPGFSPLQSRVNLQSGADLALDLVMQRIPQMLAEVEVRGDRQCQRYALEGILCRQEQYAGSHFINRLEILEKAKEVYF